MITWSNHILYDKSMDRFFWEWENDFLKEENIGERPPLSIWWLITWRCNLYCIHCYWNLEDLPKEEIDSYDAMKLCDNIIQSWIQRVSISWWEPMVRKDVFEIIEYLADNGISVIMSSNWLFVKDNIDKLKKLRHIEFSLDWWKKETHNNIRPTRNHVNNSFDIALEAIECAVKNGIKTRVLTTLNRYNVNELDQIWNILQNYWVDERHIWNTTNAWRAHAIYENLMEWVHFDDSIKDKLQDKFKKVKIQFNYPSKANNYYALILPDGCMYTQDYKTWKKIKLWSLIENPINKFWNDTNFDIRWHYIKRLNIDTKKLM